MQTDKIENSTTRIDPRFNKELEEIKKERLKRKIDKKKVSSRAITSLIPKHKLWEKIKRDILEYIFKEETNFKNE